ncbi:MAG: citryl-CoA lyase [Phycisphaerales bacterium]
MATWSTSITSIEPNQLRVRGYDIASLMGSISFGSAVYLILRGEMPADERVAKLLDAILVSSIDHGVTPPSALAARTAASTGAPLNACVAAGILHINVSHGGAIENCARQLATILEHAETTNTPLEQAAVEVLAQLKEHGQRMSGFGHRIHTHDPRTAKLLTLARDAGVFDRFCRAAEAVERTFAEATKPLPMNVDGAIAAVLADLGFQPEVMNGFFLIARVPGLIAHAIEERTTQRPMRHIDVNHHVYDGPIVHEQA